MNTPESPLGLAHWVVLDLLDDDHLRSKGYRVFMDNFYSSPDLFQDLKKEGFEACSTLRSNRRGIPAEVKNVRLRKGESHFSQDDSLLFMKWKDKWDITMISTFHDDTFIEKRRRTRLASDGVEVIQKPSVVFDQNIGGVDKCKECMSTNVHKTIQLTISLLSADQMVLYYGFAHRSVKWWKRVFFHILDTAIVNAHILYNACTDSKLMQLEFRRALAEGLLNGYEAAKARRQAQDDHLPLRLKERPFLEPVPDGSRPDCHVCSDCDIKQDTNARPPYVFTLVLKNIIHQEYIIKEGREYRTCPCSALNVCGESRTWNANY